MQCRDLWRAAVFTVTLSMVTVGAFDILPLLCQCINSFLTRRSSYKKKRKKKSAQIFTVAWRLHFSCSLPSPNMNVPQWRWALSYWILQKTFQKYYFCQWASERAGVFHRVIARRRRVYALSESGWERKAERGAESEIPKAKEQGISCLIKLRRQGWALTSLWAVIFNSGTDQVI